MKKSSTLTKMSTSVYSIIATLHYVAKFFGIYLFTQNTSTFQPEFKVSDVICGTVAFLFYALISYIHWLHAFTYVIIKSKIIETAIPLMMTLHYILFSTIIILSNIKCREFGKLCRNLTEIDRHFEYFDIRFDYRQIALWCITTIASF